VIERAAVLARAGGARVSVDLSSATLIESFGAEAFAARLASVAPDLVFATEQEREALPDGGGFLPRASWVVKRGRDGIVVDGEEHAALPAEVVDTTGAGDALAAGFLVAGPELALRTAARCVETVGAMPVGSEP
jgi:sugar/nucleoside kinase (ribokinase family)